MTTATSLTLSTRQTPGYITHIGDDDAHPTSKTDDTYLIYTYVDDTASPTPTEEDAGPRHPRPLATAPVVVSRERPKIRHEHDS